MVGFRTFLLWVVHEFSCIDHISRFCLTSFSNIRQNRWEIVVRFGAKFVPTKQFQVCTTRPVPKFTTNTTPHISRVLDTKSFSFVSKATSFALHTHIVLFHCLSMNAKHINLKLSGRKLMAIEKGRHYQIRRIQQSRIFELNSCQHKKRSISLVHVT